VNVITYLSKLNERGENTCYVHKITKQQ